MMTSLKLEAINRQLNECRAELKYLGSEDRPSSIGDVDAGSAEARKLIISSGDISDVDGLYALAEYAKTGADVLFVMNFPAYLMREEGADLKEAGVGTGFNYGARKYFDISYTELSSKTEKESLDLYKGILDSYTSSGSFTVGVKKAFIDLGFTMVTSVWKDAYVSGITGDILFCVGGINSKNPFGAKFLKNELFVYRKFLAEAIKLSSSSAGDIFDANCQKFDCSLETILMRYNNIRLDFNGSMAFISSLWESVLVRAAVRGALKGLFVMGGVNSYETVQTMPSIKDSLNRLSCATMNQLYSPHKSKLIFDLMPRLRVPVFVVSNNSVKALDTFSDPENKNKTDDGWMMFLKENGIMSETLVAYADAYYNSGVYSPPRKPFDFYSALALHEHMCYGSSRGAAIGDRRHLYYEGTLGVTIISKFEEFTLWESVLSEYISFLDTVPRPGDSEFVQNKKAAFVEEIRVLKNVSCERIQVYLIAFDGGRVGDYRLIVRDSDYS